MTKEYFEVSDRLLDELSDRIEYSRIPKPEVIPNKTCKTCEWFSRNECSLTYKRTKPKTKCCNKYKQKMK